MMLATSRARSSLPRYARARELGRLLPDHVRLIFSFSTSAKSARTLDWWLTPCPAGEGPHNRELLDASGKSEVPFLIDRSQRVSLGGSENIVRYLTANYGTHKAPARLPAGM